MADRPPGDGDEPPGEGRTLRADWTDLLDQVEQALEEAGVLGRATREALRSALGDAFEQLQELDGVDIEIEVEQGQAPDPGEADPAEEEEDGGSEPPEIGAPDVTVVDGGRRRHEPRSPRPRPDLRVASGARHPGGDDPDGPASSHSVRIIRGRSPRPALSLAHEGRILLPAEGRQAVYRGTVPRLYRLACEDGRLAVSVDGVTLETLSPGQSVDVEGAVLVVLSADERPAAGLYARLS